MRAAQAHQSDAVTGSPEGLMPSCAALRNYRPWPGILRHRDPRRQPKFAIKLPGFRRIDMLQEMFVTTQIGERKDHLSVEP
jgi:hypothetical protein